MAVTSTTVDLSRLPAPQVVEQLDYETILADMVAQVQERAPTFDATVDSDPAVKVLQVAAYRELLIRQQFNDRARSVMLAYAAGADLDQLAALVSVQRLEIDPGDPDQGIEPSYEDDEALRRRVILAPESFSVAGPASAYVFHGLTADPRVLDCSAISPAPGEVLVSVLSAEDDGTAPVDLVAAVDAVVSSKPVRPLTDHVTVQSARIITFKVEARLYLYAGPDATIVRDQSLARLADYIAASRRLGRDVTTSGLIAALYVEGVQRVELLSPAADVVVDDTQAAWCESQDVTVAGNAN